MALTKQATASLYRRRARHYDALARIFRLVGLAKQAYREAAVGALDLGPGGRVLEIGCGTGLNLPLLEEAVGPMGTVFGVDLSDAMLLRACERVRRAGWRNVRLTLADAVSYEFPPALDGIISTFALTLIPEFDDIVRRGAGALAPRGRLAVLDFKRPSGAPAWLVRLGVVLNRPFGVTLDLAERHPWESIARHFEIATLSELAGGFVYLCVGQSFRPASRSLVFDRPFSAVTPQGGPP